MNLNNSNLVGDNTDKTFGNQEFERTKVKQSTDTSVQPTISCALSMIYHWNMYEKKQNFAFSREWKQLGVSCITIRLLGYNDTITGV